MDNDCTSGFSYYESIERYDGDEFDICVTFDLDDIYEEYEGLKD